MKTTILSISFNQDYSCISCCTESGFIIYDINDMIKERYRRNFGKGIYIAEILYKSNILALVGGGSNPMWPKNIVNIWDDNQNKIIAEFNFNSDIKNVKLSKDKIIIIEKNIRIYNFKNLSLLYEFDFYKNQNIFALNIFNSNITIAIPNVYGYVVIHSIIDDKHSMKTIRLHNNEISFLAFNNEGKLLASASDKGTIIRIYDVIKEEKIKEYRRGYYGANIMNIFFDNSYLFVLSHTKTLHIFRTNDDNHEIIYLNNNDCKICMVNNKLIVITMDGMYTTYIIDNYKINYSYRFIN